MTGSRTFVGFISDPEEGLYVYEDGQTSPLSVSHVEGGSSVPQSAFFLGATPDGAEVMFVDVYGSAPLTSDAPAASRNVYVANLETGALRYVATSAESVLWRLRRPGSYILSSATPIDPNESGFSATLSGSLTMASRS